MNLNDSVSHIMILILLHSEQSQVEEFHWRENAVIFLNLITDELISYDKPLAVAHLIIELIIFNPIIDQAITPVEMLFDRIMVNAYICYPHPEDITLY